MPKNAKSRRRLTAREAAEADARMEHFLRCLKLQRIYEAAVRARTRIEERNADIPSDGR